jgi:hypothetical protein
MRWYPNKSAILLLLLMVMLLLAACGEATATTGPAAQPTAAPGNTATPVPTTTPQPAPTATPVPNQQITPAPTQLPTKTAAPEPTATRTVPPTSTAVPPSPTNAPTPTRGTPAAVSLGQPFQLRINQSATLAESGLTITFLSIAEESRCPDSNGTKFIECFWAGQVSALLEVKQANHPPETVKLTLPGATSLTTVPASATKKLDNAQLQLLKVAPHPVVDQYFDPSEYVLTLQVSSQ